MKPETVRIKAMKIESLVKFLSKESSLEIYPDGPESAALFFRGRKILSISRVRIGKFDEALGLAGKLRKHLANDRICAEAESLNVIPFGCEYQVKRQWKFAGNTGELTVDIAADNGGAIDALTLEDVCFEGQIERVEYLLDGENSVRCSREKGIIYSGSLLPVMVRVTFADGVRAEFYNGDDFWRYRCAGNYPGGSAMHTLQLDENALRWTRQILILPEDAAVEKVPRRFKALFAVGTGEKVPAANDGEKLVLSGCFADNLRHREFRAFIRKLLPGTHALLEAASPCFCTQGSHVSRPGREVPHGVPGELFDEYIWGSSAMARKGGTLQINALIPGMEESVICSNLQTPPEEITLPETEEL